MTPSAGAVQCQERDELSRLTCEHALAANDMHACCADDRVELHLGVPGRRRGAGDRRGDDRAGRRPRPAPGSARVEARARRRARARGRSRPSPRGGAGSRAPAVLAAATASASTESRSPTTVVTSSPRARACASPPSAAMTGDASRDVERRSAKAGARLPRPPPPTRATCASSAGITQVRFDGSAARRAALSARSPGLPLRSRHRNSRRIRRGARGGPDWRDLQPVPRRAARRAATRSASGVSRGAVRGVHPARRRGCRVSRGAGLGDSLHVRAPARGRRPRGGLGDDRPSRARRARARGARAPLERRADASGNRRLEPRAFSLGGRRPGSGSSASWPWTGESSASAVSRTRALGGTYLRHPSHGGARAFRTGLREAVRAPLALARLTHGW